MKRSLLTLAAGLLISSLSLAMTNASAAGSTYTAPCGKVFTKSISRTDKSSNFYHVQVARASQNQPKAVGIAN